MPKSGDRLKVQGALLCAEAVLASGGIQLRRLKGLSVADGGSGGLMPGTTRITLVLFYNLQDTTFYSS